MDTRRWGHLRRTCAKLCHDRGGELEQIQFLLGHASVQTTEHYLGCKQNLGHPVNDLFNLRADSASGNVERASEEGLKCCHGGSEDEGPKSDSKCVPVSERTKLVEVAKSHRRKVFDAALKRELQEIMRQAKRMANQMKEPADVWALERYLTQRRKDTRPELRFSFVAADADAWQTLVRRSNH